MRYFIVTALACACAFAQPIIDSPKAKGAVDFTSATSTKPNRTLGSDPAGACSNSNEVVLVNTNPPKMWSCIAGTWVQVSGGTGSSTFVGLTDVNASSPSDKQATFYDSATSKWVKRTVAGGPTGCLDFTTPWTPDFYPTCLTTMAFTWTGLHVSTPSATQSITAVGNTVLASGNQVAVSPTSNLTLTSTPTIADGADGQQLTICNASTTNTLTLQDQANLASSNIRNGGTNLTLNPRECRIGVFRSAIGDWSFVTAGSTTTSSVIREDVIPAAQQTSGSTTSLGPGISSAANGTPNNEVTISSITSASPFVPSIVFSKDASNKRWMTIARLIPTGATSLDVLIDGQGSASAGSGNGYFTVEVGCPTTTNWNSITWATASTATVAMAQNTTWQASMTGVSIGSCPTSKFALVRITRDGTNAADTYGVGTFASGFTLRWK